MEARDLGGHIGRAEIDDVSDAIDNFQRGEVLSQGRYVYANKTAEKDWQKTLGELLGKTDEEIFPAATASRFKANDGLVITTRLSLRTVETLPKDDGLHYSLVEH